MPASSADSAGQSAPSGLAGKTPSGHGGPTANVRHRRGVTTSNRPLWMMIPGGVLMIFVIVVPILLGLYISCLLYTSDDADDLLCVDLGGRRIIKNKKTEN